MKRSSWILVFVSVALVGAAAWFVLWPRAKLPDNLVSAVPADAYGAVRIRVDRVLASEAWKRLVVERGEAKGMEQVTETCGFNPLARLKEVVVFARPASEGSLPRLAFVARGDLEHQELVECVQKVTGASSTKLRREDIEGIPAVASSKGNSRAAFIGSDGIVGGDADSVRSVIKVVQGKAQGVLTDSLIRDLFQQVEAGQDVAGVLRIPESLRPQMRSLAAAFLGGQLAPLAEVRAVAGNLNLGEAKLAGGATLLATDAAQAAALIALARGNIDRIMGIPGVAFTPAGGVLRGIQTEARGDRATVTGAIKVSTVEALLELLPALAKFRESLEAPEPEPATPTPEAATPEAPAPGTAAAKASEPETAKAQSAPSKKSPD